MTVWPGTGGDTDLPPPEGDPIYVAEPYPYPYLQGPYGQPNPPPYGYDTDFGRPRPGQRRSDPPLGWILFAIGVLGAVASLLPWAVVFGLSVDGTRGDGTLTALCAIAISAIGLIVGLGHGLLWAPITACGCAVLIAVTALADINNVNQFANLGSDNVSSGAVTVGPGLWLTLLAGVLGIAVAVTAMIRRPVVS